MNAAERAEYMAIVAALLVANSHAAAFLPTQIANDAMYLWIAANRLAKGLEK